MSEPVRLQIKATCTATVTEQWQVEVTAAVKEALDAGDIAVEDLVDIPEHRGVRIVGVDDVKVEDERERSWGPAEVVDVHV